MSEIRVGITVSSSWRMSDDGLGGLGVNLLPREMVLFVCVCDINLHDSAWLQSVERLGRSCKALTSLDVIIMDLNSRLFFWCLDSICVSYYSCISNSSSCISIYITLFRLAIFFCIPSGP